MVDDELKCFDVINKADEMLTDGLVSAAEGNVIAPMVIALKKKLGQRLLGEFAANENESVVVPGAFYVFFEKVLKIIDNVGFF